MNLDARTAGRALAIFVVSGVISGCGSGSGGGYQMEQGRDGGADHVATDGAPAGDAAMLPPPMAAPGRIVLLSGTPALLLPEGPTCTFDPTATGDRWCGFIAQSTVNPSTIDLWVVNVTAAVRPGVSIMCATGAGDPNCLRLTSDWNQDPNQDQPTLFIGDTLLYFDNTGTPYAWRPPTGTGTGNGVALATATGGAIHDCLASVRGSSVSCLHDPATQSSPGVTSTNVLLGTAAGNLATLETAIQSTTADSAGITRFSYGFSPAGDYFAWSTRPGVSMPEALKVKKVGDPAPAAVVASDVSQWTVSPDSAHWTWLSGFNYLPEAPSGTLQIAPFPAGATPTTLMTNVGLYRFVSTGAIFMVTDIGATGGTLMAIPDPVMAPTSTQTLDTGVTSALLTSTSLGHVLYAKMTDVTSGGSDLRLKKVDATGGCTLSAQPNVLRARPFPGGTKIGWAKLSSDGSAIGLELSSVTDCTTTEVAPNITALLVAFDDAVFYTDANNFDSSSQPSNGNLMVKALGPDGRPTAAPATSINTRADIGYVPVPSIRSVLYTVNAGTAADQGVYLYPLSAAGINPAATP